MKNSKAFITAFVFFLGLINVQGQVTVATDKNLGTADFGQYKTFTFANHIEDAYDNSFFWDSELLKIAAREEIEDELEALGYEHVNSSEADLLVNFRFFEEATELVGWTDNYADENYWGPMEMKKKAIGLKPSAEVREPGDAKTYYLDKGSLLIQMADLNKNKTVWQGYSSGIIENTSILDPEEDRIDTAVEMIFDEYNFSALEE
ncbi:DUF4136 domain-containing protein [Marinilabilia sp.]